MKKNPGIYFKPWLHKRKERNQRKKKEKKQERKEVKKSENWK